ncbi:MAG: rhomboid family intramembrane serine protease [Bacteroidota bacterium]
MNQSFRPGGFNILPPVVKNLLIINGLFFLASFALGSSYGIDLNDYLGLHFLGAEKFRPFQFITYMFMHHDLSHIFFNMFALWMFGNALENLWGPKKFLIYYFVCGIGAAIIHYIIVYIEVTPILNTIDLYLQSPSNGAFIDFMNGGKLHVVSEEIQNTMREFIPRYNTLLASDPQAALRLSIDFISQYRVEYLNAPVVIGASGSVYGILLAFGMMFPNSLIYVYFAIPVKAKWFVLIFGAIELFSGIYSRPGDNVAHFAHLGGMIFGFLLLMFWRYQARSRLNKFHE